jgi:hypothetical protein
MGSVSRAKPNRLPGKYRGNLILVSKLKSQVGDKTARSKWKHRLGTD